MRTWRERRRLGSSCWPHHIFYLIIALYVAWNIQPFSRLLRLPENHAQAILLDLCIVMLPLVGVIAKYLSRINKNEKLFREEFIAEFAGSELVQASYNRNLIYNVLTRNPDESIDKMQVVWTQDGRCANGKIYENVEKNSVQEFNEIRFLEA